MLQTQYKTVAEDAFSKSLVNSSIRRRSTLQACKLRVNIPNLANMIAWAPHIILYYCMSLLIAHVLSHGHLSLKELASNMPIRLEASLTSVWSTTEP
jgi:hypothetical protein